MPCSHMRPMMVLKGDKPSTTKNCTFKVTDLALTSNMTYPKGVVEAPLNPDSIHPRFSKADGKNPIYLNVDICNKSTELPGSTKICLTLKSLIPSVRMRTSWYGCNTRLGSTREKVIIPSIRHMPLSANLGWMELTCSHTEVARSNLCVFRLELYFSSMGHP